MTPGFGGCAWCEGIGRDLWTIAGAIPTGHALGATAAEEIERSARE